MTKADSVHSTPPTNTSASDLYRRVDISPEDFFQALGRVRRSARDEIERLIEWLDSTIDVDEDMAVDDGPCDGDPDAEPSLGSFDLMSDQVKAWQTRTSFEAVPEVDAELDRCDDEPALGSSNTHLNQTRWTEGNSDDREGDGCADDREGDELSHGGEAVKEDDEPSLGWTDEEASRGRTYAGSMGKSADLEDGEGAAAPQNRTTVAPSVDKMRKLRRRMRGGYLDGLRFDKAMASLRDDSGDMLKGGQLSYPGGQKAFDEMLRRGE
jgi:hypothetical protein